MSVYPILERVGRALDGFTVTSGRPHWETRSPCPLRLEVRAGGMYVVTISQPAKVTTSADRQMRVAPGHHQPRQGWSPNPQPRRDRVLAPRAGTPVTTQPTATRLRPPFGLQPKRTRSNPPASLAGLRPGRVDIFSPPVTEGPPCLDLTIVASSTYCDIGDLRKRTFRLGRSTLLCREECIQPCTGD
jgi:hypothetical protein